MVNEPIMIVLTAVYVIATCVLCYISIKTSRKSDNLNRKMEERFNKSQSPLLSFKLIRNDPFLYMCVENTGNSEAKNIRIKIERIENNAGQGLRDDIMDPLFKGGFELYPRESASGKICYSLAFLGADLPFPKITVDIQYVRGNDEEKENYKRTISLDGILTIGK